MRRFLTLAPMAFLIFFALSGCGCGGEEADLVFVNDSDAVIVAVLVDFVDQGSVQQYANGAPLKRGQSFGFEAGEYPVTVAVYGAPFEDFGQKELALFTIAEAAPEGERWYAVARSGAEGLTFAVSTQWPEGV